MAVQVELPQSTVFNVPRYSVYSVQTTGLQLEMTIEKFSYRSISASFLLRDSLNKVIASWNTRFINADTDEEETDSEIDYSDQNAVHYSENVSVYRSKNPYWAELRIPFKHPSWMRVYVGHPMLMKKIGNEHSLVLKYTGIRNSLH